MKIINKVENKLFGELFCFADDEGSPLFWGKEITMKFLSKEEQQVIIGLDLYCYDRNFDTRRSVEKADSIVRDVYNAYQVFLNDCKDMENTFIKVFNEEKEEWDINTEINTKEDLHSEIQIIQVDILKYDYIISFILDDEEWALTRCFRQDMPTWFSINPRNQVQYAEMDYR